jgi:hypothetical protein
LKFTGPNRRFAGFRDEAFPFDTKKVANVEQLKYGRLFNRELFQVDVHLEAASHIAQIKKLAFTHIAMGRDPTRYKDPLAFSKNLAHFAYCSRNIKPRPKRVNLLLKQLLQLLTAEREKFVFFHGHQDQYLKMSVPLQIPARIATLRNITEGNLQRDKICLTPFPLASPQTCHAARR